MALIFIRVHSPLFFCHFSTAVFSYELSRSRSLLLKSFHIRCPDPGHFVTSQLRPFHTECPDPGHFVNSQLRPFHAECPDPGHFVNSQLRPFHAECPDPVHFVNSQLQPFHAECPDPGHSTRNYVRDGDWISQLIIYFLGRIVGLVVLLVYYLGCVDRSGSLSGSAFNQLKVAMLNIVLTILY